MQSFPGLTVIHILWEGPLSVAEAVAKTGPEDYGLYAIYGTHAVLGSDTLLYVGQADENRLGYRIAAHQDKWGRWEPSELTVYPGRIGGWEESISDEQWGSQIDRAEALTIFYTSPPYNSHRITNLAVPEPTLVLNHKRRHRVPKCISNLPDLDSMNIEDGHFRPYSGRPTPPPEAHDAELGLQTPEERTSVR